MSWWLWMIAGFLLCLAEAMSGGFFLLFFGISGIIVALLALFDVAGPGWLQWLLFTVLSLVALAVLRPRLISRLRRKGVPAEEVDALVGQVAVSLKPIPIDGVGQAELRGSPWNARNIGKTPLLQGQRCLVEHVDGLTLHVRAE